MDGVRAYWNLSVLMSRYGNKIPCPHWFIRDLPKDITLDGELWMGHGTTHDDVVAVVYSKCGDWSQMGYCVFDIPSIQGTYEDRMKAMDNAKSTLPSSVHMVENIMCRGEQHLFEYLDVVIAHKGEGLVLRKPHSHYHIGHTPSILKVKVFSHQNISFNQKYDDTEVRVIAAVDKGVYCKQ